MKAKQILQYQEMVIQTETLIKELEDNPLQVVVPNVNQILANQKKINELGSAIANNWDKAGDNAIRDLKHPDSVGLGQGAKVEIWSGARIAAVKNSMGIIDTYRSTYESDAKYQQGLFDKAKAAEGKGQNASLQAIAEIQAEQLRVLNKMVTAFTEAQDAAAAKEAAAIMNDQETQDMNDRLWTMTKMPRPTPSLPKDRHF